MNKRFLLVFSIALTVRLAVAADVPPPSPPYVLAIPAQTQWVMHITPPAGQVAPDASGKSKLAPEPQVVAITKLGDTLRAIIVYTDKSRREFWQVPGSTILQDGGTPRVIYNTGGYPPYPYAPGHDFFGCEWIKPENFHDVVKRGGVTCYHYQAEAAMQVPPDVLRAHPELAKLKLHREAWINAETRLPVAVSGETGTIEYTFSDPPPDLKMSAEFQSALDANNVALERLRRHAHPH